METAALQAMATRWGGAVNAAQADIGSSTAELANRADIRARYVADADSRYVAKDAHSADETAAVTHSVTVVL